MENVIEQFYRSFVQLDAEGMAGCYHDQVVFEDPAFGRLEGERARNMWRMLCKSQAGKDFSIEYGAVQMDERQGSAHWEAFYTFSPTGRKVHNIIEAKFTLKDGKILQHIDHFDLYRWARQAMGLQGTLIGWTPFFRKKLQTRTTSLLEKFEANAN